MAELLEGAVRVTHIVSGVAMAGGALLWGLIVVPSVNKHLPPPVRGSVLKAILPRLSRYMNGVATLALLSGLTLLALMYGGRNVPGVLTNGTYGLLLLGGLLALLSSFAVGNLGIEGTAKRLLGLLERPPTPDLEAEAARLGRRLAFYTVFDMVLVLGILTAMASAVNLRS